MRRVGDYSYEMGPLGISDSDIERILRGQAPHGPGLTRLVSMVEELRAHRDRKLRPEVVSRHVSIAASAVREARAAEQAAGRETAPEPVVKAPRLRLLPRLGTSLATFALLVGMTGVAIASDAAVPGDTLHGFDLALEKVGIGAGGAAERIAEAKELAIGGMPVEALDYVSTAIDDDQSQASQALKQAANRLKARGAGNGELNADQYEVTEMLEWMEHADLKGKDFGQNVAEWAKQLGGGHDAAPAGESNGNKGRRGNGKGR